MEADSGRRYHSVAVLTGSSMVCVALLRTDWAVSVKPARRYLQHWPQSTVETVLDDRYILMTAIVCALL